MNAPGTATNEVPVFFPAGNEVLFGVLSTPPAPARGTAVIMLAGGGYHTSVHVNRLWVRLSRRLSGEGYHGLRVDYHGVGESTGRITRYRLDQPFVEDLMGAVHFLRQQGIERYVLVGACLGGRTSLAAAPSMEGVEGVALLGAPLGDLQQREGTAARRVSEQSLWAYMRRGLHPEVIRRFFPPYPVRKQFVLSWTHLRVGFRAAWARIRKRFTRRPPDERLSISRNFAGPLEETVNRGVPILFLYGSEDPFLSHFEEARSDTLAPLFERDGSLIEVRTIEGEVSLFPKVKPQEEIIELVSEWLSRLRQETSAPEAQDLPDYGRNGAGMADSK